jgi:3-hydroxyacyl-[acyl-carrier-protein] dehydratase
VSVRGVIQRSFLSSRRQGPQVVARFRFAPELEVFRGHFPQSPLVPGVFLIEAARFAVEKELGTRLEIVAMPRARFLDEVAPGETVVVTAHLEAAGESLGATASGRVGERHVARLELSLRRSTAAESPG